ncbi:MAG: GNAT family N-acetyltransferase [Planctomycetes bacterium]|nr:GNAT family N-acetyltransferase [Planctomycetota bacterium]
MARLTERDSIRTILNQDRPWSAYALGDLAPGFFEKCVWFASDGGALSLVYLSFLTPVLIALGDDRDWSGVWEETKEFLGPGREIYIGVRPTVMAHLRTHHAIHHEKPMLRMRREPKDFNGGDDSRVLRLSREHEAAVARLYGTGEAAGESPDFYSPEMLSEGVFYGAWEDDELAAVAGTHLVYLEESVAALGNIFTRSDRRGRGLGTLTTSAVLRRLADDRLQTVILNVHQENHPARHVYERLGFRVHCPYFEAVVKI